MPPTEIQGRRHVIDGLRGFAAFGVFLHHAAITHDYIAEGVWRLPPSRFFSMVGQVGVSVFFLITGYLFWSKLIRERGRPNWFALYVGRVFRIGPVYLLAIGGMILVVFAVADWTPVEGGRKSRRPARWLGLGIFSGVPVNGDFQANLYLAGVTWSLQYEWAFYAALAALSVGARREGWPLPFTALLLLGCLAWWHNGGPVWLTPFDAIFALLFAAGMACASLEARGLTLRLPPALLSVGCLAAVVATFVLAPFAFGLLPTVLLSLAFYLVISGGDLLGLLRSRPARRLGDVSFGIYMLQGLVLRATFAAKGVRGVVLGSDGSHIGGPCSPPPSP